jgi:hypothetical protein
MNTVAARLPAIRNQLPERIDAFGEPVPQSRLAAIDPFASTPAKEDVDPLAHEVAAEDMGFGELKKAPNESDALYTFRKKLMGAVRKWRMSEAVQSSEYQAMPGKGQADDQRREALRKANRQAQTEMRNWIPKNYKQMGNDERRAKALPLEFSFGDPSKGPSSLAFSSAARTVSACESWRVKVIC